MPKLDGRSEGKGRNGYFHIAQIDVMFMWTGLDSGQTIWIEAWSKKRGDAPPLRLFLTSEDALALHEALGAAMVEQRLYLDHPAYAERLRETGTSGMTPDLKAELTKEG